MDFLLSVYNQIVKILRESPLYIKDIGKARFT